jgi:Ca2+-dependent lipid-binding protein
MTTSVSATYGVSSEHIGEGGSLLGLLSIQVISAQFMVDMGYLSKQDPYIKVNLGTHSESTTAKMRAGKSAIWDETLNFKVQERLEGMVYIWALDSNLLEDSVIGKTAIPLSELLCQQGQREIDLFDNSDSCKLTGRVLINVISGEGLMGQGISSGDHDGLSSGDLGTGAHLAGHSYGLHDQNLVIKVISAQFTSDIGTTASQDPFIEITLGHQTEKTSSKTRDGLNAVWNETLTFSEFERLPEGESYDVIIGAWNKNLINDVEIGNVKIPLDELLRNPGQQCEYKLHDAKDSKIVGCVLLCVFLGEGLGKQHGLGVGGLPGLVEHGTGLMGTGGGTGTDLRKDVGFAGLHDQNLIIQIISAQFAHDVGTMLRQDPFIEITLGHQTEKTSSKTRAGLNAVWNETLTFSKLERLPEGKSYDVIIGAWDKNLIKDVEIGNVKIPLDELLSNQGQQCEYKLHDAKDSSKIAGCVLLCVFLGEGLGKQHGLGVGGLPGLVEHGTTGMSTSDTPGGIGVSSGNLAITVNSAQFLHDQGIISKQDPYIMITIGDQTLKTKAKSNAGKTAAWDETLTFTDLGRLDYKNQTVEIRALDKDMLIDDDIGRVVIPLSELLNSQGKREYELFSRGDLSKSKNVGRVLLTVSHGLGSAGMMGMGTAGSSGTVGSMS